MRSVRNSRDSPWLAANRCFPPGRGSFRQPFANQRQDFDDARAMSNSGSAATDPAVQISPAAISAGTDASRTHSTRAASVRSVGSPTPQRVPAGVDVVLGVDRARHRLEGDEVVEVPGTVPGLLHELTVCRGRGLLPLVHQTAGQFPPPAVRHEPVPPQHQHPVLVVEQRRHRGLAQPHDVMPVPVPARRLHVDLPQPHPWAVVDRPLSVRLPTAPLVARHAHDASAYGWLLRSSLPWPRWRSFRQSAVPIKISAVPASIRVITRNQAPARTTVPSL